jgi:DNA-binding MarR family transcriptional regulator
MSTRPKFPSLVSRRLTPAAPGTKLEAFLSYRLHKLNKLSDAVSAEAYAVQCGLPLGDARCLTAIGSAAPLSVNELAQRANLDKAQASRAAQSLVAQGLVSKQASEHDARGVVLRLTRRGKAMQGRLMALVAQRNHEIFGCLSPDEQRLLGTMLDLLIAHAEGGSGNPATEP